MMKICTKCKTSKPLEFFSNRKESVDGKHSWCKECQNIRRRMWAKNNPEKHRASFVRWINKNPEKHKINSLKWQSENRGKANAIYEKYRTAKICATPKWMNDSHLKEISLIYETAHELQQILDQPFEVDHIIPLQGINVCGLHVPWNLQIVPRSDNRKKSNRIA